MAFCTGLTLLNADADQVAMARARLRDLIEFAARVGAPLVTMGSFRGWRSRVGRGGREGLVGALRDAAAFGQMRGVRPALEPLNRYESDVVNNADQGLAFVAEVAHPALGLLLDTYHVNVEERSWTAPFRRLMSAGKLWHVHLGDNNRLPPGQGLIDLPATVATLREVGYTEYLSAELLALPDLDTAAKQTVASMRAILEVSGCN